MPHKRFDCSKKYARWTLIQPVERSARGDLRWSCRCDCGTEAIVLQRTLLAGTSKSCGCLSVEAFSQRNIDRNRTHGESCEDITPEYRSWMHLRNRCINPRNKSYPNYGGRGIKVCDRWSDSYPAFLADMGRRPTAKHSIERDDVNGHYEPGNCRWATNKEQQNNKRNNTYVVVSGKRMSLRSACDLIGADYKLIWGRMKRGWTLVHALTVPRGRNAGMSIRQAPVTTAFNNAQIRSMLARQAA